MAGVVIVRYHRTEGLAPGVLDEAARTVSAEERDRADRFVFAEDRTSYLLAHALLRRTLSDLHPEIPPAAWTFVATAYGKPYVSEEAPHPRPAFNLSHTRGLVACACAPAGLVGIDVERTSAAKDGLALADRYFAPSETAALRACAPEAQRARFTDLWALKEAYIKARGDGLSLPLDGFAFDLDGAEGLHFTPSEEDTSPWSFVLLAPSREYRLAVAASPPPARFDVSLSSLKGDATTQSGSSPR